jgi:hypothetical protein
MIIIYYFSVHNNSNSSSLIIQYTYLHLKNENQRLIKRSNEEYLKMHPIFAPVFLQIIVVMVVLSISIEGRIAIVENYSIYASPPPSPPPSSTATLSSDFNFAAAGDWGCTDDTIDIVNSILDKKPELVLGLGDYSYEMDSADCWFEDIQPIDNIMKIAIGNHDVDSYNKLTH